jgi:N-acetylglucosamine-6-sulfatase
MNASSTRVLPSVCLTALLSACTLQVDDAAADSVLDEPADVQASREAATEASAPPLLDEDVSALEMGELVEKAGKPNIVLVLADDLSMNLLRAMPEVRRMMSEGLTFSRYFVSNSLCCPSRTSILTGKFPHNTGVIANQGRDGGFEAFNRNGNNRQTFAVALENRGYVTALLGKYLNGYHPRRDDAPIGWSHWAVAGDGYDNFDYTLNHDGAMDEHGHRPQDYLTDVIGRIGRNIIVDAGRRPFMIEFATFAPHGPFTPAPRDENAFPGARVPRTPAFGARPGPDAPPWLRDVPVLGPSAIREIDEKYRLRLQSVVSIDRLIKDVRDTLSARGLADETYVVFTSDNGFHLGEYSLRSGKKTAFDVDINVPLVIVGPGVPRGRVVDEIVQNVDLCPTFRDLAGAPDAREINGRSLVPFLRGQSPGDWRNAALIEHHREDRNPNDPDDQDRFDGDPPDYAAMRLKHALYVEYKGGAIEYYDLRRDKHQLHNRGRALSPARRRALHDALEALRTCNTAAQCWRAQHVQLGGGDSGGARSELEF